MSRTSYVLETLEAHKSKIVERIKYLKDTRDLFVSLYPTKGEDRIFNRLTETINQLFYQVRDLNANIDKVRTEAGLPLKYATTAVAKTGVHG